MRKEKANNRIVIRVNRLIKMLNEADRPDIVIEAITRQRADYRYERLASAATHYSEVVESSIAKLEARR